MMQRERELEGDEFTDKESFVTQAYKDQMEEVRKAEEEEKKRDGKSNTGIIWIHFNIFCRTQKEGSRRFRHGSLLSQTTRGF